MDETLKVALIATRLLDDLGVNWFLGGSLASSLLGVPRATLDADIVADIASHHVTRFMQLIGDSWYADEAAIRDSINRRSSFNLVHFDTAMKVDIFVPKRRNFETQQFKRAKNIPVEEGSNTLINVCSAEDIVAAKLEWFNLGGRLSERQWNDIVGVIRLNAGQLNLLQLRESAEELGVLDLLNQALSSGIQPRPGK